METHCISYTTIFSLTVLFKISFGLIIKKKPKQQLLLKYKISGESRVHESMQVGSSVEQHEPDVIAFLEAQDGHVGRCRPVRYRLGPHCADHGAVLQQHHGRVGNEDATHL